jgi:GDP-L-fucose synthase
MADPTLNAPIFVAGHRGLVGSAVVRALLRRGAPTVLTRTRAELDLVRQADVEAFFERERPVAVVLAAAKVGGIVANDTYPADFIRENLQIQTNVIDAAYRSGVERFVFLGSSCIYPRLAPQPMREEHLLTGPLEATNEAYAVAKIAGLEMCKFYRRQYGFDAVSLMPTNLYGPGDNFDLKTSHVLPALIRKFHEARLRGEQEVVIWGTGAPLRELLHVDDLAEACLHVLRSPADRLDAAAPDRLFNVGFGSDLSIRDLAATVRDLVHPEAALRFDTSKPDGTPRKLLDSARIQSLGWRPSIALDEGIRGTYAWYLENGAAR